jgi:hypothetical protein
MQPLPPLPLQQQQLQAPLQLGRTLRKCSTALAQMAAWHLVSCPADGLTLVKQVVMTQQ